jgi:hypothetical protein
MPPWDGTIPAMTALAARLWTVVVVDPTRWAVRRLVDEPRRALALNQDGTSRRPCVRDHIVYG